jgi:hypothetical protein
MAEHVRMVRIRVALFGVVLGALAVPAWAADAPPVTVPVIAVPGGAAHQAGVPLKTADSVVRQQEPGLPYDPLRPPASLLKQHEAPAEAKEPPLQLESLQSTGTRRVAVISGQRVMVGQSVREYRVLSLDNRQAVLQGPQGRLVLWLVPALHGQSAVAKPAQTDATTKESAGVSEKTAPTIGERK